LAGKSKGLLALWVHRQATVSAFEDAFIFAALLITIGILPALLIKNRMASAHGPSVKLAEGDGYPGQKQ